MACQKWLKPRFQVVELIPCILLSGAYHQLVIDLGVVCYCLSFNRHKKTGHPLMSNRFLNLGRRELN